MDCATDRCRSVRGRRSGLCTARLFLLHRLLSPRRTFLDGLAYEVLKPESLRLRAVRVRVSIRLGRCWNDSILAVRLRRTTAVHCEFSAINRLIVAEEGVPVERRYSFPVGIFTREVKAPRSSSDLGKGQRRERGPHGHDTVYLTFPRAGQPRSRLGRGVRGVSFCAGARFVSRIPSSVTVVDANKLMMNTMIGSGFAAVSATDAERRLPSCRHSRRPTAITA